MIVTDIKKLKKDYQVTFDSNIKLVVDEDTLVKYRLIIGKDFDDLMLLEDEKKSNEIYQKSIKFASYGKSVNQMIIYLNNLGVDDTSLYIEKLKKAHYLNDMKMIRNLMSKQYSYVQLEDKLNFYQFDSLDIDEALKSYDETKALYKIYSLALKKYSKEIPSKKLEKIYRYLVSKGFSIEHIIEVMK